MKLLGFLLIGLSCSLGRQALADNQPKGNVLEVHSCELYAGGCIVSSEATLGGRYMVRAWNFTGGSFQGTDLTGLSFAVLQSASDNLAAPGAQPGSVVVYLPRHASQTQRAALVDWLKASQADLRGARDFQTRLADIQFNKNGGDYALSIGDFVSIKTASLDSCPTGACGDSLWYTPRANTSVFTVAVDRSSKINEPLLQLKWSDSGRRCIFVGKFGEETPAKNLFVTSSELCGAAGRIF